MAILDYRLRVGWLAMGFTSMVAQIILLRELLVVFYGNEISLGIILANWLFWTGVGSLGLSRLIDRVKARIPLLAGCYASLSLLLPLLILLVRMSRTAWGVQVGEIIGFAPMICTSFLVLAPISVLCGFLFVLNSRIVDLDLRGTTLQVGRVYIFEAVGAAAGGIGFSYLMIKFLGHVEIVAILGIINAGVALLLLSGRPSVLRSFIGVLLLVYGGSSWLWTGWLDSFSNRLRFRGTELVHTEESTYGNVAVTRRLDQISFYESGLLVFSSPDDFSAEEAVHFALLQHPSPKSVLLIGGGVGGSLREVLKHDISRIDYVELDPAMVRLARKYMAVQPLLADPRVRTIHADGRFFMKSATETYDCIILDLPDPFTAQINRFYTVEFFREARRVLNQGGVLSFRVSSAENYIGEELARFLSSIDVTLGLVFEEKVIVPGESNVFIAAEPPTLLTSDPYVLLTRLAERKITTKYVSRFYLPDRMSGERVGYLWARIRDSSSRPNHDFHPISYYYNIVLWSSHFRTPVRRILQAFSGLRVRDLLLPVLCLGILALLLSMRSRSFPVLLSVATTGAAEIVMEVACIIAFQVLYGFVYSRIGVITAAFMVGLTTGSLLMVAGLKRRDLGWVHLWWIQIGVCLYPLVLIAVFHLFAERGNPSILPWVETLFPVLTFVAGFVGGLQFPLANRLYLAGREKATSEAGTVYGVDLFGSCAGAVFASAVLIPILGILNTCYFIVSLNLVSVVAVSVAWARYYRTGESS